MNNQSLSRYIRIAPPNSCSVLSIAIITGIASALPPTEYDLPCEPGLQVWQGDESDDFLLSSNWCNWDVNGLLSNTPVYIGPIENNIQGSQKIYIYPHGPAILRSDFSTSELRMVNGIDTFLTVQNATYSCGYGTIGSGDIWDIRDVGTSTLTLDNAIWDGAITLGWFGKAKLRVLGSSQITGRLSIGRDSDAEIINEGYLQIDQNINVGINNVNALWENMPGSTLELHGDPNMNGYAPVPRSDLINNSGATILKTGKGTSTIDWKFRNSGIINVLEGRLESQFYYIASDALINIENGIFVLDGWITGNTTVNIAPGSRLEIRCDPLPSASLDLSGDIAFSRGAREGTLNLDGIYRIIHGDDASPSFIVDVVNSGEATLAYRLEGSYLPAVDAGASWTNLPGSTFIIDNGSDLTRYQFVDDENMPMLTNESGATIRKVGIDTSEINWKLENSGLLEVQDGLLEIHDDYSSNNGLINILEGGLLEIHDDYSSNNGHINILGGGAAVQLNGWMSGEATVTIANGGLFEIKGRCSNATFYLDGDIALNTSAGTTGLTLGGEYRVILGRDGSYANSGKTINIGYCVFDSKVFAPFNARTAWTNAMGSTLELTERANFDRHAFSSIIPTFLNDAGALIKIVSTGGNLMTWIFTNKGTIDIQGGVFRITNNEVNMQAQTSVVMGSGTLNLEYGIFMNDGVIAPSPADPAVNPDGLKIDTQLIQCGSTSIFTAQVGSLSSKLTCTGTFEIGGLIDVQRTPGFEPDGSEVVVVLQAESVSSDLNGYFINAVPEAGQTAFNVQTNDLEYDVEYTDTSITIKNISLNTPQCSPADLNNDTTLNFADISAFLVAYADQDPIADFFPDGNYNFTDISEFLIAYAAGCP